MMNFGFSYVGAVFLVMLFVPNLFWTRRKPAGYEESAKMERRGLVLLERCGEVLVTCTALCFADFNPHPSPRLVWLIAAAGCMVLYEIYWIRYFRSDRTLRDFYSSLLGIPVAGATLPVAAFLLLGIYGKNPPMLLSVLILGIGHIGIHLEHRKALMSTP